MSGSRFKVTYIHWWNRPVGLYRKTSEGIERVGWVWMQRAYLVNNLHHGWIAFIDDQTPEKVEHWFCQVCGAPIRSDQRQKIEESIKGDQK